MGVTAPHPLKILSHDSSQLVSLNQKSQHNEGELLPLKRKSGVTEKKC